MVNITYTFHIIIHNIYMANITFPCLSGHVPPFVQLSSFSRPASPSASGTPRKENLPGVRVNFPDVVRHQMSKTRSKDLLLGG